MLGFFMISSENALSNQKESKVSINGSGLEIPRMVSLKNSLDIQKKRGVTTPFLQLMESKLAFY